ncbi:MAG: universal stress protein [Rhizobacter sp.]|nr:universal stress protein [Rhizobacter sp.]
MNLRSLLVHLDNSPACETRTQLALQLAHDRDCHLVGLAPTGLIEPPPAGAPAAAATEYTALAWDSLRDQAERASERFTEQCRSAGARSFEVVIDEAHRGASIVSHAHCSDLTVMSQTDPAGAHARQAQDMLEQVVLFSPRPTLVVPHAGRFAHVGRRILLAWDDSREAARAAADALPLLSHATLVQVVQWNEPAQAVSQKMQPRLEAFRRWLMWHGVPAEVSVETTSTDVASAIHTRALDERADLIVMGAYGHPRWAERVMGGATRGLLSTTTVPVLMSH